jgi:hypothetical protein
MPLSLAFAGGVAFCLTGCHQQKPPPSIDGLSAALERSLNAQGQVSIIATIPENNIEAFKAALRHEKAPLEKPSSSTRLIEILINNSATPTSNPSPP